MATLDIRGTVVGETAIAIKAPCLVATTGGNITLSGVQTVDGMSVGNNAERVLVKDQATAAQNGVYIASTGPWVLAADFANNNNVALGTLVLVTSGAINQGIIFEQICADNPIVIGTSNVAFAPLANAVAQSATSTTSLTIGTGAKTLVVQAGKAFAANQYVVIYETSNVANSMLAQVTSYAGTSLVVNSIAIGGSGTHTDWSIVLTNSSAAAGIVPPVGSGNVTGPGSSTTGHVATFADASGKVIQDGGVLGSLAALNALSAQYLASSALAFGAAMVNGTLNVTLTDSNTSLTIAIKTLAGNDPSAADPVWFVFNESASNQTYTVIEQTAALSIKIPAGSTLGTSNNTAFRFWLLAVNNSGSVALAVINCLSGTNIYPLAQGAVINTTAFAGSNNAAQVPYTAASVGSLSSVPYSVLGFLNYDNGLATAGTYGVIPTKLRLHIPSMVPLPGAEVQSIRTATGAVATGTTTVSAWANDTVPTNAMGDHYAGLDTTITPTSAANLIDIESVVHMTNGGGARFGTILLQDSTVNCLTAEYHNSVGAGTKDWSRLGHRMLAATLSATTFKINAGGSNAGTNTFNGEGSARTLAGKFNSYMLVREIMA